MKDIPNVIFVQSKKFKENETVFEGYNITRIPNEEMITSFLDPQILDIKILDEFEIYEGIKLDKKSPIILINDPLVTKLGAKLN